MIRQIAAPFACEVREAESGDIALDVAHGFRPEVVTMDLKMQGIGGIEATRALMGICPEAKVLIVTSYDQPVLREAAAEAGAIGFVVKDSLSELECVLARFAKGVSGPRESDS